MQHPLADLGTNTIGSVSTSSYFDIPNLKKLGLLNIEGVRVQNQVLEEHPTAAVARMTEKSKGKDTTIGHWEIAGLFQRIRFQHIRMDSHRRFWTNLPDLQEDAY